MNRLLAVFFFVAWHQITWAGDLQLRVSILAVATHPRVAAAVPVDAAGPGQ